MGSSFLRSSGRMIALMLGLIGGWMVFGTLLIPVPVPAAAQGGSVCPQVVTRALESVGSACDRLGRNSACYGFQSVSATFAQPQPTGFFSRVGDTAGLTSLQTIRTAPLDLVRNLWGVALMNVQASLPNTLPGETVTFLLLGDSEIENTVAPADAFRGGIPVNVRTIAPAALHQQPQTSALIVATVDANTPLPADARTEDGWYRVASGGQYGWVEAIALNVPAPAARLPVYTPGTSSTPMQAFFLRTGAGSPVCNNAPSALIVQGPQNLTVDLTVNGADLRVGSTVVIRTLPENDPNGTTGTTGSTGTSQTPSSNLEISVLDGTVIINPDTGDEVVIEEGQTTSACLSEPDNLGSDAQANDQLVDPTCGWTEPQAIADELLNSLILLDQFPLQYPISVVETPTPTPPTPQPNQPELPTAEPPTPAPTFPPLTPIFPPLTPTATATFVPGVVDLTFIRADTNATELSPVDVVLTYHLRNIGGSTATNIRVDGIVPIGALYGFNDSDDFFPRSSSGRTMDTLDIAPGNFWLLPSLAPGETAPITIGLEFKDGSAGESFITNPTITADQPDFNPANDGGSISFDVPSTTNLSVVIAPLSAFNEGNTSGFSVTVENISGQKAENVTIPLTFTSGLTPLPGSPPSLGSYDPVSRVWTIPRLNPGDTADLFGLMQAGPGSGGTTQTLSATIGSSFLTDFFPANNTASQSVNIGLPSVDLRFNGVFTFNPPFDEGALTYNIDYTIENLSSTAATGVQVTDLLPATTGAAGSTGFDLIFNDFGDPAYDFSTDTWTIGLLEAGGTRTLTLSVNVEPLGYGKTLTASPTISQTQLDDDPANNVGSLNLVIPLVTVDLGFNGLNVVNMPYREGDNIFITHTIRNFDPDRPSGEVTLNTPLPPGVAFSSYGGPGTYDSDNAILFIPSIPAATSINASFTVTINPGTAYTNLSTTATINSAGDSTPGNNDQLVSFFVSARGDLGVTVSSSTTTPLVGSPFTLTYTVTNNGPTQVQGIALPFNLAGLTAGTPLPSQGTANLITGMWTIGTLASGSNATLTLPLTAPPITAGTPQTVTGGTVLGSNNTDSTPGNDNTSITITPVGVVCNPTGIASAAALITAIENANNEVTCSGANTIALSGGSFSFTGPYDAVNALPPITSNITIMANGSTLSGGASGFRLFEITASGSLTLIGATVNNFQAGTEYGAAFRNAGTLAATQVIATNNTADFSGVLWNDGTATFTNSTMAFNGQITQNNSGAVLNLVNTTLYITGSGAGITNYGTLNLSFTTLWNTVPAAVALFLDFGATTNIKNSLIGGTAGACNNALPAPITNLGGNASNYAAGECALLPQYTLNFEAYGLAGGNGHPVIRFNTSTSTHFNQAADCLAIGGSSIGADARGEPRPLGPQCDPGAMEQL